MRQTNIFYLQIVLSTPPCGSIPINVLQIDSVRRSERNRSSGKQVMTRIKQLSYHPRSATPQRSEREREERQTVMSVSLLKFFNQGILFTCPTEFLLSIDNSGNLVAAGPQSHKLKHKMRPKWFSDLPCRSCISCFIFHSDSTVLQRINTVKL